MTPKFSFSEIASESWSYMEFFNMSEKTYYDYSYMSFVKTHFVNRNMS